MKAHPSRSYRLGRENGIDRGLQRLRKQNTNNHGEFFQTEALPYGNNDRTNWLLFFMVIWGLFNITSSFRNKESSASEGLSS